jgi:2-dehydro-3-deoxyphosphooctonate aldolase (KDO 8-P synthase)
VDRNDKKINMDTIHKFTNILAGWLPDAPKGEIPFVLMAGPCAIEDSERPFEIAERVQALCQARNIPYIFKGSYRKANRTGGKSFTGIGDERALEILSEVGRKYRVPVVTDIHESHEAALAAQFVDVLQIPAFLCRQTDLLQAAAVTGKIVNIKKGQFMSGEAMGFAAEKVRAAGNEKVVLTERGNSFGYQDLVVDYRNIPWMHQAGQCPVVMDITHSLQQPNQRAGVTGGRPELIGLIARAGIVAGANGIFIETHPNPEEAKSDAANMLKLDLLEPLLDDLVKIAMAMR